MKTMHLSLALALLFLFLGWPALSQCLRVQAEPTDVTPPQSLRARLNWKTIPVDPQFRAEGVAVADVNRDGKKDVLVGEYWYEAPDWKRHEIYTPGEYGDGSASYSSAFLCYTDDINRDGWPDLVVIGFPGTPCHWYSNPQGRIGHWTSYEIWHSACNETPLYVDLFKEGRRVLVMGWQPEGQENAGQMAWFELDHDKPAGPWLMHPISRQGSESDPVAGTHRFSHGLGTGDLNGDGRSDVLCTGGWWEQPEHIARQPWTFHPAQLGEPCANMYVDDLDGDTVPDVLTSSAHNYGIWWHKGQRNGGELTFSEEALFPHLLSQTHALMYVDIDGNGLRDLVTGKRWWAHGPSGDPGSDEPSHLYWFEAQKDSHSKGVTHFTARLIHADSGVGLQFAIDDMNEDGLPDIITSNKKGIYIHEQTRAE